MMPINIKPHDIESELKRSVGVNRNGLSIDILTTFYYTSSD